MKLTVWIAAQEGDATCYNIVARTKKDALAQMAQRSDTAWSAPIKRVIEYRDAFDLFEYLTSEGGGRHEYI